MSVFCLKSLRAVGFQSSQDCARSTGLADGNDAAQMQSAAVVNEDKDDNDIPNQIPQSDTDARRERMNEITKLGLKHVEDKKVRTTLLGHEVVVQDAVADAAGLVGKSLDLIKASIEGVPYASVITAGISLILPLLKNPTAVEEANRNGFIYVTSRMRYYDAMKTLLSPVDLDAEIKSSLNDSTVDLYTLIIEFQVESVLRFYRSRTKDFLRGAINYDVWSEKLQRIKDAEAGLVSMCRTTIVGVGLQELSKLASEAEQSGEKLSNILAELQSMDQDPKYEACLQSLRVTDPRHDKIRIEKEKGGLLKDSYRWILNNPDFRQWQDAPDNRLLWIKGDPGKGKTMLLCGIIDELERSRVETDIISFFFCQETESRIKNATSVLRGLIYLLVVKDARLIQHVQKKYDTAGKQLFEDQNAWFALSEILANILQDPGLETTYLIIDALDECPEGRPQLLEFLVKNSTPSSRVKWIVSSRNWPDIEKRLNQAEQKITLRLELNEQSVSAAVIDYIEVRVKRLAEDNEYDDDTKKAVRKYLLDNANETFLWVALVCQELASVSAWEAKQVVSTFPPGLDSLYCRMVEHISKSKHAKLCKSILAATCVVYRPITLDELPSVVDMPPASSGNSKALAEIIGLCGSFLTLRDRTVVFVHQSAKDYLLKHVFSDRKGAIHHDIFSRSIRALTRTLRRNIYGLHDHGYINIRRFKKPEPDPLAPAYYSTIYWVDHLLGSDTKDLRGDLADGRAVDEFLRQSFLYWVEALAFSQALPEGELSIEKLEMLLQVRMSPCSC